MEKYFPLKRVLVMIASIVVNTIAWVPSIQQVFDKLFPNIKINWLGLLAPIVLFGFAVWIIIDLCKKLESRPFLLIKSLGSNLLTDPQKGNAQLRFEHYYDVSIINSLDKPLGIIDIRLELKYKNLTKNIIPYIGIPDSDFKNGEKGVIPGTLYLQPNEPKEGILAFVEEKNRDEEFLKGQPPFLDANIIVMDTRKRKYIFPATIEKMTEYHMLNYSNDKH